MRHLHKPQNLFIDYLEDLVRRQDLGALAALRRGLGKTPGMAMDMQRYVEPWLGRSRGWEEEVYFLTAALFAYWHQGENTVAAFPPENLGASMASLAASNPDASSGLERRFTGLLKSHRDDLPSHLRQAVGLLKSKGIPVHWRHLWRDLRRWDHQEGRTQRSWARSFWGRQPETATENLTESD